MEFFPEAEANFDLGEVVHFEYHPEGSEPVILETMEVEKFNNLGLLYEEFDDLDDFEASSVVPSRAKAEIDQKEWLIEVKQPEEILLTKRELKDYVKSTKNENTVRKTDQIVTAFQRWLSEYCIEERPIHTISPEELDNFIANYLLNKKTSKGTDHQPDTLTGIHRGILRHLKEKDYQVDPLHDDSFTTSRDVLQSKRTTLKKAGLGNKPNRAEGLDEGQIDQMWKTGALGESTPESLQNTVYFFLNVGLGLRGCHEARQMCWGDIEMKQDEEGTNYLEWNERASKTRTGSEGGHVRAFAPKVYATGEDAKCPVYYYKQFAARRPRAAMEPLHPFYLTVKQGAKIQDQVGYTKAPMGVNKLREIVKNLSTKAGLDGRHTNHSLRKTTCQTLMAADVPPVLVAQLSGHKSLSSLNNYTQATRPQQKAMSSILTGSKRSASAALGAPQNKVNPMNTQVAIAGSSSSGSLAAPTANTSPGPVSCRELQRLTQTASGMFSGATINGSISLNINYNVHSNSQANVHVSPLMPKPAIDE